MTFPGAETGSAGRRPAGLGGPPNPSNFTFQTGETVESTSFPEGRRRVGDDRPRAAYAPPSRVSSRLRAWWHLLPLLCLPPLAAQTKGPSSPAPPYFDHRSRELEFTDPADVPRQPDKIKEVVIGWFGPSDPSHPSGGDLWTAARLTVEQANASGGWAGRPIRLAPCWAENPWSTGVARLFKRVYEENVVAILGSIDGASTHLAEQVVAKARLPLVSPVSTDTSVNLAGVPWMFSCAPSNAAIAGRLADAVAEGLGGSPRTGSLALVNATDHDSRALAGELLRTLAARLRVPAHRFEFTPGGNTFEAQLRALIATDPSVLFLLADAGDSACFLRALRRSGSSARVLGGPAMGQRVFRELAGEAAAGVRFPALSEPHEAPPPREDSRNQASVRFRQVFREATGHEPDAHALLARDATQLLVDAIHRAGPDRAAIRQALRDLSPWQGLAGRITFDGVGRNTRSDLDLIAVGENESARW